MGSYARKAPGTPTVDHLSGLIGVAIVLFVLTATIFYTAAGEASTLAAIALILAPPVALLGLVRPHASVVVLAALLATNAAAVLRDVHGAPGVGKSILLLVLAGMLLRAGLRRALVRVTPLIIAMLLFALARLLSALPDPGASDMGTLAESLATGVAIVAVLGASGADDRWVRVVPKAVFAATGLLSLLLLTQALGFEQTFGGFGPAAEPTEEQLEIFARGGTLPEAFGRLRGPVDDPNFWAQSLLVILPIGLWWAQTASRRSSRILALSGTTVLLLGLVQTQSRGGLIALVVGVAVLGVLSRGLTRVVALALPAVLVVGVVATGQLERISVLSDLRDPATAEDEAVAGRLSENLAAWEMFKDHPVIGIGANRYEANYSDYAARFGLDNRVERQPHNSYLEMASESGALGLAAFLAMLLVGLHLCVDARRRLLSVAAEDMARLSEALLAGLASYATAAIFLHQAYPDYLWLVLGFVASIHYYAVRHSFRPTDTNSDERQLTLRA